MLEFLFYCTIFSGGLRIFPRRGSANSNFKEKGTPLESAYDFLNSVNSLCCILRCSVILYLFHIIIRNSDDLSITKFLHG
mgnify:CR=1 FL=1